MKIQKTQLNEQGNSNKPLLSSRSFLREGDILIAINECKMGFDGRKTLTIGKEYTILKMQITNFGIKDDFGHDHYFELRTNSFGNWKQYFKRAGAKKNGR